MNVPHHRSGSSSLLKHARSRFIVLALIFIAYLSVWSVANWPALRQAWWYYDDFGHAERWYAGQYRKDLPAEHIHLATYALRGGLVSGRPGEGLWFLTFLLDGNRDQKLSNILLRFAQGAVHCLAATVAAVLIWKQTKKWTAFLSVLPFLLWPFNGEAVLWRTVGTYPIAALLGLLGVYIIRHSERRRLLLSATGALCVALAMLTNQVAALAGLVVWMLTFSLLIQKPPVAKKQLGFEAVFILSGYATGGTLSYILTYFNKGDHRVAFVSDYIDKQSFLVKLNELFIVGPDHYPDWLTILHVTLLLGSIALVIGSARQMGLSIRQALLSVFFLMTALVTPYATLLLVSQSWPSWRVMYVAPFLMTGAWVLLDQSIGTRKVGSFISIGLLSLILIGYISISWVNSSEYVQVFEADLRVLSQIENYASEEHIPGEQVFVATAPDFVRGWNPHGMTYMHGDSKISSFLKRWTAHPFIRWFSWLRPVEDATIKTECLARCQRTKEWEAFQFYKLQNSGALCVCP